VAAVTDLLQQAFQCRRPSRTYSAAGPVVFVSSSVMHSTLVAVLAAVALLVLQPLTVLAVPTAATAAAPAPPETGQHGQLTAHAHTPDGDQPLCFQIAIKHGQ
jgi:hypothetical protein